MATLKRNASLASLHLLILIMGSIILSGSVCGSKHDATPGVAVNKDSVAVVVRQYYPNYVILQLENLSEDLQKNFILTYGNAQPGCVQDDFNGDGFTDYALLLLKTEAESTEKLVVLRGSRNGTFIPTDLYEIGMDAEGSFFVKNCFIKRTPPGEVEEWDHSSKVVIKYPGIEWINWESSSCVYYWQDGEFRNIWTWEPRDEVKGDVARMMFYMVVRYEGDNDEPDLECYVSA